MQGNGLGAAEGVLYLREPAAAAGPWALPYYTFGFSLLLQKSPFAASKWLA
jgi:hypothetical protein